MKQSAKGEVIFESEACYQDEKVPCNSELSSGIPDNEHINRDSIRPEDAFQAFNGKVFAVSRTEFSIASKLEKRVESPMQRYSRLRCEIDELKTDLDAMTQKDSADTTSLWSMLQRETASLSVSVASMESHSGLKSQQALNDSVLDTLVESVQKEQPSSTQGAAVKGSMNIGSSKELVEMDRRVHRLEALLNYGRNCEDTSKASTDGDSLRSAYPLMDTINRLEERIQMLDAAQLDKLQAKARMVQTDIDAALKSKSTSSTAAAEAKLVETMRRAEELLSAVQKTQAVAEDVPALVLRLKSLEHVHQAAGTFAARLNQLEEGVRQAAGDLRSNRDVLSALKDGMVENLEVMQQNVKAVDARLEALQSRTT